MYKKEFDLWNDIKKNLEKAVSSTYIRAGEIRWASIGVNVGSEMDGKGKSFTRPVLVLHVIGKHLALVLPVSTKIKDSVGYLKINFKGKEQSICLHQMKIVSQKRIFERQGKISEEKLKEIKEKIKVFYSF